MSEFPIMRKSTRNIAYGVSDFEMIQSCNKYFVDKTSFLPLLEEINYIFFIRPRRFGKSLWLSILSTYYDCNKKHRFSEFFKNTWIGEHPTEEQGKYLILYFNFSVVRADPDKVEQSFEEHGSMKIHSFCDKYQKFFTPESILKIQKKKNVSGKLDALFDEAEKQNLSIYLLIDEYDNFANTILSTAGNSAYHDMTHGDGFYRNFFAVLKGGTSQSGSGLKRLFITGVSPITLDDVTSGFNMAKNISLSPQFNVITGFTEKEVRTMLEYYQQEGVFLQDIEESLQVMRLWYNNYRFSEKVTECVYNTDMVIYFVLESIQTGRPPNDLIDSNIRIDYGKLRHLMQINRKLNGNFDRLKSIIEDQEISSVIHTSFPLEHLKKQENFISLLYFFGLLTFAGSKMGEPLLKIPNRTVWQLMYSYLREGWRESEVFTVDFWEVGKRVQEMAWLGEWEAFFDFLADAIHTQTGIRDYLSAEKVIQGFLLAYLNLSNFYITRTEKEMNKGFADIFLEPFLAKYPDLPHAYLIELKYFKRGQISKPLLKQTIAEAERQLTQYLQDAIIQEQYAQVQTTGLVLVFHGWELVYRAAVPS